MSFATHLRKPIELSPACSRLLMEDPCVLEARLPRALIGFRCVLFGSRNIRFALNTADAELFAQATPNGLTWLNFAGGIVSSSASSVNMARLVNKAGNVVQLSVQALLNAMSDFQQDYEEGRFGIDIYDAPGPNSWPMAYLTFFAMQQNQTKDDCSNVDELLDFVAWIHTNDE